MMSFVIKTNSTVLALYHWRLAVIFLVFFISFVKICSSSIIPPQNHGLNRDHDFGAKKMKARSRKTLCEDICQLIIRGNTSLQGLDEVPSHEQNGNPPPHALYEHETQDLRQWQEQRHYHTRVWEERQERCQDP